MEMGGADNSPPLSDNAGSWAWTQWGIDLGDISALSGLNTDSNLELCGLVEDKEIAARAVAFVVNSTRKGIVPLCADVANLFRSKQSLERKLYQLKRDNALLISSASSVLSQSVSPTPPSVCSYSEQCTKDQTENSTVGQGVCRSSSRCSNCSSTMSGYSPKIDKSRGGATHRHQGTHSSFTSSGETSLTNNSTHVGFRATPASKHSSNTAGERLPEAGEKETTDVTIHREPTIERQSVDNSTVLCNDTISTGSSCKTNPSTITQSDVSYKTTHKKNSCVANNKSNNPELESGESGSSVPSKAENLEKRTKTPKTTSSVFSFHIENEKINGGVHSVGSYNDKPIKKVTTQDAGDVVGLRRGHKERSKVKNRQERLKRAGDRRRQSLPEMTSTPNIEAFRVRPKISKETQCSIDFGNNTSLEEAFVKSAAVNTKLAEDLGAARREVEELKRRLKLLDIQHQAAGPSRPYTDGNQDCHPEGASVEDKGYFTSGTRDSHSEGSSWKCSAMEDGGRLPRTMPVSYSGNLANCKCSNCQEAMGSEDDLSHYSDKILEEPAQRFAISNKLQVQLDDHVVIKGDNSGYIRYLGHVDKCGQPTTLYAGLEMDNPVGNHDGHYWGKRYFFCPKNNGLFVPLTDVLGHYTKVVKVDKDLKNTKKKPQK